MRPGRTNAPSQARRGVAVRLRGGAVWLALLHLRGPPACRGTFGHPLAGAATGGLWQRRGTSADPGRSKSQPAGGSALDARPRRRPAWPWAPRSAPCRPSRGRRRSPRTGPGWSGTVGVDLARQAAGVQPQLVLQRVDPRRQHRAVLLARPPGPRPARAARRRSTVARCRVVGTPSTVSGPTSSTRPAARSSPRPWPGSNAARICSATGRSFWPSAVSGCLGHLEPRLAARQPLGRRQREVGSAGQQHGPHPAGRRRASP